MMRFQINLPPPLRLTAHSRGFTLVELMIVVVIIAALAAISGPSIARSIHRNRIANLNRAIVNGFNEARSFAMSTGEAVLVFVDTPNNKIEFLLPANFGDDETPALSCAMAEYNSSELLFEVDLESFGTEQEIKLLDPISAPGGSGIFCLSPNGKILRYDTASTPSWCDSDVSAIIISSKDTATNKIYLDNTCPPNFHNLEQRTHLELHDTYFVTLSYSGQITVKP